jgi:uncharacterized protein (DUF983 family)
MPEFRHPRPKIVSYFLCKCPRCGVGEVFGYSILNPIKFAETHQACSHCQLTYQPEPGFFFGAMYWSYAMIVALIVTMSVIFSVFDAFDYAIWGIPVAIVLSLPVIFRYSRMLMLYLVYPSMFREIFSGKKLN